MEEICLSLVMSCGYLSFVGLFQTRYWTYSFTRINVMSAIFPWIGIRSCPHFQFPFCVHPISLASDQEIKLRNKCHCSKTLPRGKNSYFYCLIFILQRLLYVNSHSLLYWLADCKNCWFFFCFIFFSNCIVNQTVLDYEICHWCSFHWCCVSPVIEVSLLQLFMSWFSWKRIRFRKTKCYSFITFKVQWCSWHELS